MMKTQAPREGSRSPWGAIDYVKEQAPGIWNVGTPGHGGIKLDRRRNAAMPEIVRRPGGWYEEDCEWALVALVFPEVFAESERESAVATVKSLYPDEYTALTGLLVAESESYVLRKRRFDAKHFCSWVARAAWGSWAEGVPEDMVGVVARQESTMEERWFLVPSDEHKAQDDLHFVVDPERHRECAPLSGLSKSARAVMTTPFGSRP